MNERPPSATLFLHEDILARTLAYEQDQRQWRISELESGRDDPGRPTYEEVSSCPCSISAMPSSYQYFRYLMVLHLPNIACMPQTALRVSYGMRVAKSDHCISIMIVPALITQPVRMHSLSSILFYTVLSSPQPSSLGCNRANQFLPTATGTKIVRLWWWDPPPELIEKKPSSEKCPKPA